MANDTITIARDDLIKVMALAASLPPTTTGDELLAEAWMRCWNALVKTPAEAIALHERITKEAINVKVKL